MKWALILEVSVAIADCTTYSICQIIRAVEKKNNWKILLLIGMDELKRETPVCHLVTVFFFKESSPGIFQLFVLCPVEIKTGKAISLWKSLLSILHFLSQKSLTSGDEKATFKKTTDNFLDLKRPNSPEGSSKKKKKNYAMQVQAKKKKKKLCNAETLKAIRMDEVVVETEAILPALKPKRRPMKNTTK